MPVVDTSHVPELEERMMSFRTMEPGPFMINGVMQELQNLVEALEENRSMFVAQGCGTYDDWYMQTHVGIYASTTIAKRKQMHSSMREWVDRCVASGSLKEWKGITMEIVD